MLMLLEYVNEGPVRRVQLVPEVGRSALGYGALVELDRISAELVRDPSCRVIVLEGRDGLFCSGMDLDAAAAVDPNTSAAIGLYAATLQRLRRGPPAVLSVVDGPATAGGVGLVAVADIAIASERATFGLPEAILDFLPAMVLPLLMERMPAQRARRFVLRALAVDAQCALGEGLLDEVVADSAALEKALRRTLKELLRLSPRAVAELKTCSAELATSGALTGIAAGAERTAAALQRPETLAAISAFVQGQPLPWFDRYRPLGKGTPRDDES